MANKPESQIERMTMPVWPDAGKRLGLGRNATYEAIARGEIPVLRFGRRIVVPTAALDRLLENGAVIHEAASLKSVGR